MRIQDHEIKIKALDHGFVVTVGCKSVAIKNKTELMKELGAYLDNPSKSIKKYFPENKFGNVTVVQGTPTDVDALRSSIRDGLWDWCGIRRKDIT